MELSVSVDFGQTCTLSDHFQVLGCNSPQHLPHHQFSSENSTDSAKRLQKNESAITTYPNIYTLTSPQDTTPAEPPAVPINLIAKVLTGNTDL